MTLKTQDIAELRSAILEGDRLSSLPSLTGAQRQRLAWLESKISLLKAGIGAEDEEATLAEAHGIDVRQLRPRPLMTEKRRMEIGAWQQFIRYAMRGERPGASLEQRDEIGGNIGARIGAYTNLGHFVPTDFYREWLPLALQTISPLLSRINVTYVESTNAHPLAVPYAADVSNVAVVISENTQESEADLAAKGFARLGGWTYRTPRWIVSREAFEDVESADSVVGMFELFVAQRIGLGVGADLVNGNGTNKPLGLIASLLALAGNAGIGVVAQGSSANDGSSATGANSIGSRDLNSLYFSVPEVYRNSPKCAWLMNDSTAQAVSQLLDKSGRPLLDVGEQRPILMGKPVKIDPNFPSIGASQTPVAFGDFSYWMTRCVTDSGYIAVYQEAQNLVDYGKIGLRAFQRYDGALLYAGDSASKPPIRLLQNHS